jgi:L-ascorbate metabolism protein UlaG (beta-lactamase superfamily)
MNITKYEHACVVLEKAGVSVVIDPGSYTDDFVMPQHVAAVLITHTHPDHCDADKITSIVRKFPDCKIYAHRDVAKSLQDTVAVQEVSVDEQIRVGGFDVEFVGGQHAMIHSSIGRVANVGILVDNGQFYYPGDSFFVPNSTIKVLALPVSAPWLKISESIDFLNAVRPRFVFPTHDAILSKKGQDLVDGLCSIMHQDDSASYQRIHSGETKIIN